MSQRIQRVVPFHDAAQFAGSEENDNHIWCSPGFLMQWKASTSGVLPLHRETKFIIGFDFAVTLSSPESLCVLFDITSAQLVKLKSLMFNKHER